MAYGSPESLDDIEEYYLHVRHGRKVTSTEVEVLKNRYRAIGGHSPLIEITRAQAAALERKLANDGLNIRVYIGMKHSNPLIAEAVRVMASDDVRRVIALALAPHYSRMSIGSYREILLDAIRRHGTDIEVIFVENWHLHPLLIEAWVEKINEKLMRFPVHDRKEVVLLFSAHSLPEKILDGGDPYPKQLLETCGMIADKVGGNCMFAYQSAGHTGERWLGPDIMEKLQKLKTDGYRNVLLVPIGFVSDHLEILYDLDVECRGWATRNRINFERASSLNTSPIFIAALASLVEERLH